MGLPTPGSWTCRRIDSGLNKPTVAFANKGDIFSIGRPESTAFPIEKGVRMIDSEGLDLLRQGRNQALRREYPQALRSFQRAFRVLAFHGEMMVHPQFLSHYAASLAAASGRTEEGRRLCERSIQLEPYEPEHYLNLGLVLDMAGKRSKALGALHRGLSIRPDHPVLLAAVRKAERRRILPFPFLSRNHLLNRCLGKFLAASRTGLDA
jgi:tetratricopeptide (TPR) repeat protein